MGEVFETEHVIDLTDGAKLYSQIPYHTGPYSLEVFKDLVEKIMKVGLIEPVTKPSVFPVVIDPKKDESYLLCIDYRRINATPLRDSYYLLRMDELIDS